MKIVDKFPRNKRTEYDWDILLDGQCRELIHGEDFQCKPVSFCQLAYTAAKSRNKKAHIKVIGDSVFIQAKATQ